MTVTDQRMRDESLARIINVWMSQQPDAAKAWIEQSNLSAEQKSHLLSAGSGH